MSEQKLFGPLSRAALEKVALRFKALGDPTRLSIIQLLLSGEKTVGEIYTVTNMNQANISKHLSILLEQGILSKRKFGLYSYYKIKDESITKICELVCNSVSKHLELAQSEFEFSRPKD